MRRALPFIALACLVLLFYRQAAFTNLIFARGDTLLYFYPYWDYRAQSMLAGQLPLWNPYLFMGVPFLANSQAGVFYPLNWPLAIFAAPAAVKIALILHAAIAAWGTYVLARRTFHLDRGAAFFAALVFALGGYLTAQAEHVNQFQGLAWLPWAVLWTHLLVADRGPARSTAAWLAALSLTVALQLTAGHTQTSFITVAACGLTAAVPLLIDRHSDAASRSTLTGAGFFAAAVLLALGQAAIQLVPTFELSRLSLRGGGLPLNEAVSFSLNPLLVGRALLPGYSRVIFSEFVAYTGVVPLLLIAVSVTSQLSNLKGLRALATRPMALALLLAGLGLFFALGGYNPLYLLLARLPGFSFFRVPARWLVLWALGAALLAGHGLQSLKTIADSPLRGRAVRAGTTGFVVLLALTLFSAGLVPPGELGPIGLPALPESILWVVPFLGAGLLIDALPALRARSSARWIDIVPALVLAVSVLELFVASSALPLNHLTTPEAYSAIRPAMTQLLAARPAGAAPPDRFLSLSALEFDPGDLAELRSAWEPQLPADAVYDAVVATKHKEVLSPNLPLTWQAPSVDGYDGGILPLRAYADFIRQFGEVPPNTDGRLRQFLKTLPPNGLLNLTNTRWVITDKTGDAWVDDVFYDLGLTATATSAAPLTLDRLPAFQATALGLVLGENSQEGVAQITLDNGETVTGRILPAADGPAVRLRWESPAAVRQIVILTPTVLTLRGASLIDERTDSFRSLTLGPYRLAHSGDVKVYENLNVFPRAFLAITTAVHPQAPIGEAAFVKYEAGHVVLQTDSDTPGYLVLADASYPGWSATVDSQPAEILTAYGLFRAVAITPGTHFVEFRFDPPGFKLGAGLSALSLLILILIVVRGRRRTPATQPPAARP